jgi:EmrB/QacA subfamily drug resistance transporter
MKQPCDEAFVRSGPSAAPCRTNSAPWVLAATILASSMAFIDGTVVNVALPALQSSLHATVVDVQWVVESYGLFLSALILAGGAIGDSLGRRRVFLLGAGLFAAASIGCGLSTNISELIVARSIQGVGAAALVPSSLAIISASFDEKSRGQAIGTWSGFTAITTAFGPLLGGWLIQHASWHWVFFINVPIALAVIVISLIHVPESRSPAQTLSGSGAVLTNASTRTIDWLGSILATLSLAGLAYGFIESATLGWSHPIVIASLIAGAAFLFLFVRTEQTAPAPMLPLRLFQSSTFAGANLLTLLLYAALGFFFFIFPLNLIQIQGYTATEAGAAATPMILLIFFLSRWSGGLVARHGPRTPLIVGPLMVAAGFLLFAVPSVGGSYWSTFFPALIVLGSGMAVSVAPLTTVVMNSVERDRTGTASGVNNAVARVAGVLSIAILGVVMVQAFAHTLDASLSLLNLTPEVSRSIQSNLVELADINVPSGLNPATAASVHAAITQAFVFAFRVTMLICSALAIASAGVALKTISPPPGSKRRQLSFR